MIINMKYKQLLTITDVKTPTRYPPPHQSSQPMKVKQGFSQQSDAQRFYANKNLTSAV